MWCTCSCYYTSTDCKYFIDGECFANYTLTQNSFACDTVVGGYFSNGRCYYRAPQSCRAGYHLQQCTCFRRRSSTYSSGTCSNIGGLYTADRCYYDEFDCRGYAVNGQCYSKVTTSGASISLETWSGLSPSLSPLPYTSPSPLLSFPSLSLPSPSLPFPFLPFPIPLPPYPLPSPNPARARECAVSSPPGSGRKLTPLTIMGVLRQERAVAVLG